MTEGEESSGQTQETIMPIGERRRSPDRRLRFRRRPPASIFREASAKTSENENAALGGAERGVLAAQEVRSGCGRKLDGAGAELDGGGPEAVEATERREGAGEILLGERTLR
jgi:hypothetical protein